MKKFKKVPFVEFMDEKNKGRRFYLTKKHMSLGRADVSDIVLDSPAVSRTHAYIIEEAGYYFIIDNQSKNKVRVNGSIKSRSILKNDDFIELGDFALRFVDVNTAKKNIHYNLLAIVCFILGTGLIIGYFVFYSPSTTDDTIELLTKVTSSSEFVEQKKTSSSEKIVSRLETNKSVDNSSESKKENVLKEKIKLPPKKKKFKKDSSLKIVLREGYNYLKEGDFESAEIAFGFANILSPNNELAKRGLELSKTRSSIDKFFEDNFSKRKDNVISRNNKNLVDTLLSIADMALSNKQYQKAINTAEKVRKIEIAGETRYLNQAKQIIDKAKIAQREEFEPFMEEARNLIKNKAYLMGREICREMLKKDDSYLPAKECIKTANKYLKQ